MRITSTRLLVSAIGLASTPAIAQTIPDDLALSPFITSDISEPVALRHAGDGSNRIFIVQKNGTIRVGQLAADGSPPQTLTTFLSRSVTTNFKRTIKFMDSEDEDEEELKNLMREMSL